MQQKHQEQLQSLPRTTTSSTPLKRQELIRKFYSSSSISTKLEIIKLSSLHLPFQQKKKPLKKNPNKFIPSVTSPISTTHLKPSLITTTLTNLTVLLPNVFSF
jgi:hypothetical protein